MMRLKDRSNKVCLKLSFHGCKNCGFVCVHVWDRIEKLEVIHYEGANYVFSPQTFTNFCF